MPSTQTVRRPELPDDVREALIEQVALLDAATLHAVNLLATVNGLLEAQAGMTEAAWEIFDRALGERHDENDPARIAVEARSSEIMAHWLDGEALDRMDRARRYRSRAERVRRTSSADEHALSLYHPDDD